MNASKLLFKVFLALFLVTNFQSCYYDNMQDLNPQNICDTFSLNYSGSITKILNDNCTSCHSGSTPEGNIRLDSYNEVRSVAQSGKLYSSVSWNGAASKMPKNANQLSGCSIATIRIWIEKNYPQ